MIYYEKPYFVVPADDLAEEAFIVLREALRRTKKVGLGQLAMRGREYVVSLKPCGRGMVLETLRYADEVNKAQGYFRDIPDAKPDAELLDLAETLIEKKTGKFDPQRVPRSLCRCAEGPDRAQAKAKGKQDHRGQGRRHGQPGSNVVDLMAALKKSLEKPAAQAERGGEEAAPAKKAPREEAAPAKTTRG